MHGNEFITEAVSVTLPEAPVPHVGDYIDYTPDTVTTPYTLYGKYSGYGTYKNKVLDIPKDQEITQDTLKWQILKIYDDGSIDLIGTATHNIYFVGALGYNNGVFLLNDICKTLYSKTLSDGRKIEARSVRLEDFEDEENGGKWKEVRDVYTYSNVQYGGSRTYTGTKSYYPNLYAREIGAGINTEEVNKEGLNQSDKGYTSLAEETYSPTETPTDENTLTVTQTAYVMPINETNYGKAYSVLRYSADYWLASRYVLTSSRHASFRLYTAGADFGNLSGNSLTNDSNSFFTSDLQYYGNIFLHPARPVVHLEPSVQLNLSDKATNASYPHKIIKY